MRTVYGPSWNVVPTSAAMSIDPPWLCGWLSRRTSWRLGIGAAFRVGTRGALDYSRSTCAHTGRACCDYERASDDGSRHYEPCSSFGELAVQRVVAHRFARSRPCL